MKYKEWLDEWIDNYIRPTSKAKTYTRYSEIVRQHIKPKLGDYEMNDLTPLLLQKFITELVTSGNLRTGKGLAINTVNVIITVVQSSLKTAFNFGYVNTYSADKIKRPKPFEKRIECFNVDEQKKIEQYILKEGKPKLFGIVFCLYTGLRIGELLALEWSDIDFEKCTVSVTKTCYEGKNVAGVFGRFTDAPKTKSSVRTIPVPKQLMPLLKRCMIDCKSKYVVSDKGKAMSVRSYQRTFERLLKRLNISRHGFHSVRHTFATRAIECGMDVKTLSEILGHKNPSVTLLRYAHSLPQYKIEMMDRLGKLL